MKRTINLLFTMLFIAFCLTSCGGDDSIIGTWEGEADGRRAELVFGEGGTGSVAIDDTRVDAKWTVEESKYLTVEIGQSDTTYKLFDSVEFSINDGTLTLLDNGEQAVFTRKK